MLWALAMAAKATRAVKKAAIAVIDGCESFRELDWKLGDEKCKKLKVHRSECVVRHKQSVVQLINKRRRR